MGCKHFVTTIVLHSPIKPKAMIPIAQILRSIFKGEDPKPSTTSDEPALHPVHEKDVTQGGEFLDDLIRTDDIAEDEIY